MADITMKTADLEKMYRIHEDILKSFELACSEGCAVCCTRNVCVTSLEVYYLLHGLEPDKRDRVFSKIHENSGLKRQIPEVTINAMADMCMKGEPLPEEESDPAWGPCPLLEDNRCSVYALRPFSCRAMVSSEHCGNSGFADMDEFLVTVNNVFMQYLEHMDQGGMTSNLTDMVLAFSETGVMESYRDTGKLEGVPTNFLKNRPVSILMIPPEHRKRIEPVLASI